MDCLTLRKHQQKTETVKKYKSVMKIFFYVILNKVLNRHLSNELNDDLNISNQ